MPLRPLGQETFGRKLRRAREESGVNLRVAADLISGVPEINFVSYSTLSRLEALGDLPSDFKRRTLACLAFMAYGVDPADVGLDVKALPGTFDQERFLKRAADLPRNDGREGTLTSEDSNLAEYVDSLVGAALPGAA